MQRYILHYNYENKLVMDFYDNTELRKPNRRYSQKYLEAVLRIIFKSKINQMGYNEKEDILYIKFDNCILKICNYQRVSINLPNLNFYVKKFLENRNLSKLKISSKVKRTNKHNTGKVVVGLLTAIIISGSICGAKALSSNNNQMESTIYTVENNIEIIDDDSQLNMDKLLINYDDNSQLDTDNLSINYDDNSQLNTDKLLINYDDNSATYKAQATIDKYGSLIGKYSKTYGLDKGLLTAIATQERGVHSDVMDPDGATGLMQIQNSIWVGKKISAYNFDTETIETLTITKDMLSDVSINIKIGCMIFQNCLEYMDYNIPAAIQCYNMGYGNVLQILNCCGNETQQTVSEILNNPANLEWLNYRSIIKVGDCEYLEHVLSWMGDNPMVSVVKNDGDIVQIEINNNNKKY